MKKLLLLITLLVSFVAQAYEPLVREDRVWVYGCGVPYPDMETPGNAEVEFSGTTEINGVVYHNLTSLGHPENVISLMREENKKVYRYIANNPYYWNMWNGAVSEAEQAEYNVREGCNPGEILLYDFDRELGDPYMSLTCGNSTDQAVAPLAIVAMEPQVMLRDGLHPMRQLNMQFGEYNPDYDNSGLPIYDGIGPVEGFLDIPGCGPWCTSYYNDWSYYLDKVYDKNTGKIIYDYKDKYGYMPMIVAGLQWYYERVVTEPDGTKRTIGNASYSFTSEVEKDGKKYLAFTDNATGEIAAYMRQEGPLVYQWINPETSQRPVNDNGEELTENLLYDFSITSKTSLEDYYTQIFYVKYPIYTENGEPITAFVDALKRQRIEQYPCSVQHVEFSCGEEWVGHGVFVQSVGPKTGRLFEPLAPIDGKNEKYEIRQLLQGETVLYTRAQLENLFSGIEEISTDEPENDNRMYDLMGSEIRNPQRGAIYIQNSRKLIAR